MPADTAIQAAEQFRAAVLSKQRASLVRLVNGYGAMYQRLQLQIDALTAEIDAMALQGDVTPWKVGKLDRLEALKRQIADEATRYGALVEGEIDAGAREMVAQAQTDAKRLARAALPGVQQIDAAIMTQWQSLNPEAVQSMLGFLSDESPMRDYLRTKFGPELSNVVSSKMLESIGLGYNPRKLASALRQATGQGLDWSLRTARTAQLYAYREGSRAAYAANPDVVKGWTWLSARTANTCMACIAQDGTVHKLTEALADHYNGKCLAPGTLVESGSAIMAFVARPYDGDMVTIRTASGQLLSVTPNHPILTDNGWVAAGLLKKGGNVIRYRRLDRTTASVRPDKDHVPSRVEDIPRALGMSRLASMPTAAKDFHGDGKGSDVHVVWANCLLCGRNYATFPEPVSKQNLGGGATIKASLSCFSPCHALTEWHRTTSASSLSGEHDASLLVGATTIRQQTSSISATSHNNAAFSQSTVGHCSTDMEVSGERLLGLAGKVALDQIVNVEINPFHGSVYNLQTKYGWYSANNIITHNCAMLPVTVTYRELGLDVDEPPSALEHPTGEDWFKAQPESVQRQMMGPAKWAAWQDGKVPFDRLTTEHTDPVYGQMKQEASLKAILGEAA